MCDVTKWSLWDGQLIEWGEGEKQKQYNQKKINQLDWGGHA